MGTFGERVRELQRRVGEGDLVGSVEYDQVYAKIQHEALEFEHPQGGGPKYLENTIKERYAEYLQRVAETVFEDGGEEGMTRSVEDLALEASRRAPIGPPGDTGDGIEVLHPGLLRSSGHPKVTSDGTVVYDRPGAPRERGN